MIGFIGCGNMARAIIDGVLAKGLLKKSEIVASAKSDATKKYIKDELGIVFAPGNKTVVEMSDIIVFGIKPQMMPGVIDEIKDCNLSGKTFVSMAPGKTFEFFQNAFGKNVDIVRTAPNTPATVGEGMTSICAMDTVNESHLDRIYDVFNAVGRTVTMEERLIDVAMSVSGSSPAFVFMFIEALADGAVAEGMPRTKAYELAAQAVLGSAKMVLESKEVPAKLKDAVCSPAGTTIEGVNVLEREGMRASVMDAVRACVAKSKSV